MQLATLNLEGYKAFPGQTSLEIRPLTIVFGRNNAGKSALLRAIPLVTTAITSDGSAGVELQIGDLIYCNRIADLVFGPSVHGQFRLGGRFKLDGKVVDLLAQIQNLLLEGVEKQVVSELQISVDGAVACLLKWVGQEPQLEQYTEKGGMGPVIDMPFSGILPAQPPEQIRELVAQLRMGAKRLSLKLDYLCSLRERARRFYARSAAVPLRVGFQGELAPHMLAADPALLEQVSNWYRDALGGWNLDLSQVAPTFELLLRRGNVCVNLADAGDGMAQVLPIAVQRIRGFTQGEEKLEIVEQPTEHLHPSAHGAVADLFVPREGDLRQVVVETHSEVFLLRIRRRVAEGLDPDKVAVYFVHDDGDGSTLERLDMNRQGEISQWPDDVFSEDYDEIRAIRKAARPKVSS